MTLSALLAKAAREVTWDDIIAIATNGYEEGPQFELKRELSANANQTDPWMGGSGKVGRPAVDDLAKEIVALANCQGGIIVVGIDESDDRPARAAKIAEKLVPWCAECADRLNDTMLSLIDPRLPGLSIMGIERFGGAGEGVLVIHVPRSTYAPHGYGSPPRVYTRRGHRSDPITMSELQAVLWDTRTRSERIRQQLAERQNIFADKAKTVFAHGSVDFRPREFHRPDMAGHLIGFRATVIAEMNPDVDIRHILRAKPLQTVSQWRSSGSAPAFERFSIHSDIVNRPRAIWQDFSSGSSIGRWTLSSDGIIEVAGFRALDRASSGNPPDVWPGWFTQSAWEVCALMYWLRGACGNYFSSFFFSGDVFLKQDTLLSSVQGHRPSNRSIPESHSVIGPRLLTGDAPVESIFREVESEIIYAFGATEHYRERENIDFVFERLGIEKPG